MTHHNRIDKRNEVYKREEQFHDHESGQRNKISFFYDDIATKVVLDCTYDFLGDLKDKKVLEIGCGKGSQIVRIAKEGALVTGIDISTKRVEEAFSMIERFSIHENAKAIKMNAESLDFPENSFDLVLGISIIHHLELVLPEIKRVLKQTGKAVFLEPLGENPIINLYRKMTPKLRTEDEHPLKDKDFKLFHKNFSYVKRRNFYLLSLLSFTFRTLIKNEKMFMYSIGSLNKIDRVLMYILPYLGKYCWQTVIMAKK